MKKLLIFLTFLLILPTIMGVSELGTVKQDDCISLYQYCPSCTYVNYTALKFPNGTIESSFNLAMTKTNSNYNFSFCGTGTIGQHFYTVCGDKDGSATCEDISFEVTPSGFNLSVGYYFLLLALSLGIVIFGLWKEDITITLLGGFGLGFVGLYIMFFGITDISDPVYTWGISILLLSLSFYILVRSALEYMNG